MRLSPSSGLLAFAASVHAFADTSPFVFFSTAEFDAPANSAQLQSGHQVMNSAKAILESCPTAHYQVISQPNASASDIKNADGCTAPSLCRAVADPRVKGSFSVAEVVGEFDAQALSQYIQTVCEKAGKTVSIRTTSLPAFTARDRATQQEDYDLVLGNAIDEAQNAGSYSVFYLTRPVEASAYEADFDNTFSDELRKLRARDVPVRRASNDTEWKKLPLFEKYQFFTPGIFHGIFVLIFILSILTVGLRALNSLEVPYGAFEKDMGPAAQKKQN